MSNIYKIILLCLVCANIACASFKCGADEYCVDKSQLNDTVYATVKRYIANNSSNDAFVLFSSTYFDLDSETLNKKFYDIFLIGPNYYGLIDSTGIKRKFALPDDYAEAYEVVVKNKVAPRRYPLLHCHIGGKIVFIQSTIDDFVSNNNSIEFFRSTEIPTTNGRNRFMRESMCIIKKPNGEVKTFIVGDSILMNDNLREHY